MKKLFATILSGVFAFSALGCATAQPAAGGVYDNTALWSAEEAMPYMQKVKDEYENMLAHLEDFPVNFIYDNVVYSGFGSRYIKETSRERVDGEDKTTVDVTFKLADALDILLKTAYYPKYDTYDYTVYFENKGSVNSGVIEKLNAIDISVTGGDPVLKTIGGDHMLAYAPLEYDLKQTDASFKSTLGRSCHEYFPYFNLEHEGGGALFALGWAGTWQADFVYDAESNCTRVTGSGVVGLKTYLKPGETVRTPLMAVMYYEDRDEDKAMNKWRQWMIHCNLPNESADSDTVIQPHNSIGFMSDSGDGEGDGITENHLSYKKTADLLKNNGVTADFRWHDTGWYVSADGTRSVGNWWGTVGLWEIDRTKWPNNTFRESVDYTRENLTSTTTPGVGTKTMLWFEPERVTYLDSMVHYGYKRNWAIRDAFHPGSNESCINNLGIPECLDWTFDRIIAIMDKVDIDLYREDCNVDFHWYWPVNDAYQGDNRVGITENLYIQGHYELWDRIIAWCAKKGKCTYVDSCASGGGRNDLETVRRSVPCLRSDADRTTIALKLAFTTSLTRWLPYSGCSSYETDPDYRPSWVYDMYTYRASYVQWMNIGNQFYSDNTEEDWANIRQAEREWLQVKEYFYNDFYVLTPIRSVDDKVNWTVYSYYDGESDSGVVQAFRPIKCTQPTFTVGLKGVNPDKYYTLRDLDGVNSATHVKGSELIAGFEFRAENPRTAIVMFIEAE